MFFAILHHSVSSGDFLGLPLPQGLVPLKIKNTFQPFFLFTNKGWFFFWQFFMSSVAHLLKLFLEVLL